MASDSLVFRLNDHGQGPELLRQVFLERGWREFEEDEDEEWDWNLWWRTSRFRTCDYDTIYPWQRLNHYPKSVAITKKDGLARNMRRMKAVYGASVYNFSPNAFNLPNDYTKFVGQYSKSKDKEKKELYWICKPADLSRGRGIFLFRDLSELQYDCNAVVQEYITNPMLISGYKFDLRIYVMVPSFQPLQIYIYQEGLVRFSTEKFDLSCLGNMYSHLTNTSINKHSPAYNLDKERVGPGCKWTITQLRHFFWQTLNIDDTQLWGKIINIVILTLLVQATQVPKVNNCFELYGFDILIDEKLKPWLLEVNFSPALSSDCQTDILVKKPLLHDLTEMLHFSERDKKRGEGLQKLLNPQRSLSVPNRGSFAKSASVHPRGINSSISRRPPSKLPDLPYAPSSSSTFGTMSQLSWPSMEEEDEGQSDVVPIVPGCGLPSVQQPHRPRSSSSSGHSSGSPVSSDLPEPYPRVPAIRSERQPRPVSKAFKGRPNSLMAINKSRGIQKRESKVSMTSDSSGISSFSGSSEGSDPILDEQRLKQKANQSALGRKQSLTAIKTAPKATKLNRTNSDFGDVMTKSTYALESDNHTVDINSNYVKPVRAAFEPKSELGKQRRLSHMPFTNNGKLKSSSKAAVTQQRLTAYAKPWKGRGSEQAAMLATPPSGQPVDRVGDFVLVWPSTEASRKCGSNLDPRTVIRECQKLMKDRSTVWSENAKVPVIWGPLHLDSAQH